MFCQPLDRRVFSPCCFLAFSILAAPGFAPHVSIMARHLQAAAKSMKATTNKESRAEPLANAVAFGEVFIVQASWTAEFIAELRDFPAGKYKDQVDAASLAYLALVEQTVQPRKAIMARMPSEATMCKGGWHRPVEKNAEYCCPCCEAIAAFNDPTMQLKGHEHDQACIQRYFNYTQEHPLPDYSENKRSQSFPRSGVGGLANWRR